MQLLSINIGQPQDIEHDGKVIRTAIFKNSIDHSATVETLGIAGDGQADLTNHGGIHKAVYAYGANHFPYWSDILNGRNIEHGAFGENLTIDHLDEGKLCIGDYVNIGDVQLMISQPRIPCFKLGVRFNNKKMVRLFKEALRPGIYFQVITTGVIEPGMSVDWQPNYAERISVKATYEAIVNRSALQSRETFNRLVTLPTIPSALKHYIDLAIG